jgi:hypothetical protein
VVLLLRNPLSAKLIRISLHFCYSEITCRCIRAVEILILDCCFVFGAYTTACHRLWQKGFLATLLLVSHVQDECRLVFKMVRTYRVKQHISIYNSYVKNNSAHVCHWKVQQKFPGVNIPTRSTIHYLVNKFKIMSLLDKRIKRNHILTKENMMI